jgi:hypothetical protein
MRLVRLAGVLLLVFSVGMGAGAAFAYARARAFVGSADRTQGVVVEILEEQSHEDGVTYGAAVEFSDAAGEKYTVRSTVFQSSPPFQVGDTVEVAYPPATPDEARIYSFWELWFWAVLLAGMAALAVPWAVFFLFVLPWLLRRRARDAAPAPSRP